MYSVLENGSAGYLKGIVQLTVFVASRYLTWYF